MSEWKALAGRVTLFLQPEGASGSELSALELYKRIWEADPDNFQKSTNPLFPSQAQGKRLGLTVACSVHPLRIDFNLAPTAAEIQSSQPALSLIEDTTQLRTELMQIATVLGKAVVPNTCIRVALFVHFVNVNPNVVEANKKLISIMPEQYRVRLTNEEEFALQINSPRPSLKFKDLRMNFISKWSVDRIQVLTISLPMGGAPAAAQPGIGVPRAHEFIAAGVSFDCNNVPDKSLSADQQSALLFEGLTFATKAQYDYGLKVEGFEHAERTH